MSRIFSYTKTNTSLGSIDGTVKLTTALRLNPNKPLMIRFLKAAIDSQIPNVYNYNGTNTGLVRTSKDGGTTWDTIQLTNGVYSIEGINLAIRAAISSYWTSSSDPGFTLAGNTQTFVSYLIIDSSKLAVAGQFCIDFEPTGSSMSTLLGYTTTTSFSTDGIHTANTYTQMSWIGNSICIYLYGLGDLCFENGASARELCRIPMSASQVNNEFVYPTAGIVCPWITIPAMSQLQSFTLKFLGSRSERQCLLLEGQVNVVFELKEA